MKQYKEYVQWILDNGVQKGDRTGTGTLSAFGYQMRFNLAESFPLVTLKKTAISSIIHELVWFLKGSTNTKYLTDNNVHIWDEWAVDERRLVHKYIFQDGTRLIGPEVRAIIHNPEWTQMPTVASEWSAPEGWWRVEYVRNGTTVIEYQHPQYYKLVFNKLVEDGYIPASAREELGALGPVYGAQWRNWEMLVEEEDISFEAKLKRVVEWNDRHKEILAWPTQANSDDMTTAYGLVHRKVYSSQYPYFFEPYGETAHDKHVNLNKFHDELESVIRDGKCTPPMYQHVVKGFDQIDWLINRLKTNPDCRRLIVSAWNVADLPKMALAPCHALFQFWSAEMSMTERLQWAVDNLGDVSITPVLDGESEMMKQLDSLNVPKRKLSCQLYQRSVDSALGCPYNIASYAILTMMIAQCCNMLPGDFVWTGGDCHLYSNHMEGIATMMARDPLPPPQLRLNPNVKNIFDFTIDDFELVDYNSHPFIKFPIAV